MPSHPQSFSGGGLQRSLSFSSFRDSCESHQSHGATAEVGMRQSSNGNNGGICVEECKHYQRKCNIVAPCCGKIVGCRKCHDEKFSGNGDCHDMNRYEVTEIICKVCNTRQKPSNECEKCHTTFGEYFCKICNFWSSNDEEPFHCEKCKMCRIGGKENYIHCDKCNMCYKRDTYENHKCSEKKFEDKCHICHEFMQTSRKPCYALPCCGCAVHKECFSRYTAHQQEEQMRAKCFICREMIE